MRAFLLSLTAAVAASGCGGPEANTRSTDAYERYLGLREGLSGRHDPEAMAEVVRLLEDRHPLVAVGALEALEERGDPAFLQHASTGLKHPAPLVREYACRLVGALRRPEGVPILVGVLKDPEASVRRAALKALAKHGADPVVLKPLAEAVGDKDPSVSWTAHELLQELTKKPEVDRRAEAWRKAIGP
jgi:HEAT repeat protein